MTSIRLTPSQRLVRYLMLVQSLPLVPPAATISGTPAPRSLIREASCSAAAGPGSAAESAGRTSPARTGMIHSVLPSQIAELAGRHS